MYQLGLVVLDDFIRTLVVFRDEVNDTARSSCETRALGAISAVIDTISGVIVKPTKAPTGTPTNMYKHIDQASELF